MDIFNPNGIEENFPINVCRCCLAEGCYKDISSEYFISGKKEVYEEMLKDVFNLEISYQKYGGPSRYSRLICENCIGKLRDAKEFKYKVLASEKYFIKFLDDMQINVKQEENNQEADIISKECAIKVEPELNTENDVESCESCDVESCENRQVVNYYDVVGIKIESESNIDNEIESHEMLEDHTEENHSDVVRVKSESELKIDIEIESHQTLEDHTEGPHHIEGNRIVTLENIKLYVDKNLNNKATGEANVCDKRTLTTEGSTKTKKPRLANDGTRMGKSRAEYMRYYRQKKREEQLKTNTEMGKSRAEYMRYYRQKKREEKLKSEKVELKKIARNSTERSRDFRARAVNSIRSQMSTTDPTTASPNLVVNHAPLRLPSLPFSATMSTSTETACNTGPAEIYTRPVDVEQ